MQTPFSYNRSQRPTTSDSRPHTAYSSFPTHPIQEERDQKPGAEYEEDSDDQSTPRASLAGLTLAAPDRKLSRDDTATNLHTFALEDRDPHRSRIHPRVPFGRSSAATTSTSDVHAHSSKSASLGRRFSRTMGFIKERTTAPLSRRPSATVESSTAAPAPRGATIPPPVSPSKRATKANENDSMKKQRTNGVAVNDRKDTPAPASVNGLGRAPGARGISQWSFNGGDSARRSAAAQAHGLSTLDFHSVFRDSSREIRRGRISSVSSANDSGADLSSSCPDVDSDGDVNMDTQEGAEPEEPAGPKARDFVQILPSEISLQIFEYLNAHDLLMAQHMSPAWHVLANEVSVWRSVYIRKFGRETATYAGKPIPPPIQVGGAGTGRPNKPTQPWNRMYKARVELEKQWRKGADQAGKAHYLSGHTDSVYCVQFDEEKIITGSRDRTIRVWDINTFQCIRVIGGPNVRPVAGPKTLRTVDYPAFHLATASVNGTAYGDSIFHTPSQWHDASILCLQYDSEILVTGSSDSDLLIWDIHTYEPIKRLRKHTGGVLDVALDAKYIVSCSKDSRIIVWDRETYEPIGELTGHRGPVNAVQLRGHQLVSASGDGIARLWDLNEMKLIKEFSAKERGLAAVEFSEDMKYVLAGGNDHITYKFDVETGREVQQFTGHSQLVRSLWLDSSNSRVVSGSYDLDLRVYDFNTGEEIWRAEEWTTSWMLAAKSDYRRIVATSQDGRILLVDFGLIKGGRCDGQRIKDLDLLRGTEYTTAVCFRNPWTQAREVL